MRENPPKAYRGYYTVLIYENQERELGGSSEKITSIQHRCVVNADPDQQSDSRETERGAQNTGGLERAC